MLILDQSYVLCRDVRGMSNEGTQGQFPGRKLCVSVIDHLWGLHSSTAAMHSLPICWSVTLALLHQEMASTVP